MLLLFTFTSMLIDKSEITYWQIMIFGNLFGIFRIILNSLKDIALPLI